MIRKILIVLALLAPGVRAEPLYSPNGYWPTGILDPHCPHQYEYVLEPGHVWLGCWGLRN